MNRFGRGRSLMVALAVGALAVLMSAASLGSVAAPSAGASAMGQQDRPSPRPFRGLGTWVDVYDYGPAFQGGDAPLPAITPESVDDMAKLGVKTLYLQAAQDDSRSEGTLVDRKLVGDILRHAHRQGVKVVAWYLPHFADVDRDMRYIPRCTSSATR